MKLKFLTQVSTSLILFISCIFNVANAGLSKSADRFWSFDGTYTESVSNLTGASVGGATFSSDRDGNVSGALDLDGFDDSVHVASSTDLAPLTDITMSLWFQLDSLTSRAYLFDTRAPESSGGPIAYMIIDPLSGTSGRLNIFGNSIVQSGVNDGSWHNLIYTKDVTSNFEKVFFDGAVVASTAADSDVYDFNSGLSFGSYGLAAPSSSGTYWTDGRLDDVAIWSRSISDAEALEIFNSPASATNATAPATLTVFLLGLAGLALRRFKK